MTYTQAKTSLVLVAILGISTFPESAQSQHHRSPCQKHAYQKDFYQKGGCEPPLEQERAQEEMQQGAYQAPPPTGPLQGPTRQLDLGGGEIEFPALRLKMPRIRLPAFSRIVTPPRMRVEESVAPLVQQFQEQISVPNGESRPTEAFTEPDQEPAQKGPYQKARFERQDVQHQSPDTSTFQTARSRQASGQFALRPVSYNVPMHQNSAPGQGTNHRQHYVQQRAPEPQYREPTNYGGNPSYHQPPASSRRPAMPASYAHPAEVYRAPAEIRRSDPSDALMRQMESLERRIESLRDERQGGANEWPSNQGPGRSYVAKSHHLQPIEEPRALAHDLNSRLDSQSPTAIQAQHPTQDSNLHSLLGLAAAAIVGSAIGMGLMWLNHNRGTKQMRLVNIEDNRKLAGFIEVTKEAQRV